MSFAYGSHITADAKYAVYEYCEFTNPKYEAGMVITYIDRMCVDSNIIVNRKDGTIHL